MVKLISRRQAVPPPKPQRQLQLAAPSPFRRLISKLPVLTLILVLLIVTPKRRLGLPRECLPFQASGFSCRLWMPC